MTEFARTTNNHVTRRKPMCVRAGCGRMRAVQAMPAISAALAGAGRSESAVPAHANEEETHFWSAQDTRCGDIIQRTTTPHNTILFAAFFFFASCQLERWCCVAFTLVSRSVSLVTLASSSHTFVNCVAQHVYEHIQRARTHAHAATSHQKNLFVPTMLSCVLSVRIFQFVCLFLCVCVLAHVSVCGCVLLCCPDILSPPPIIPHTHTLIFLSHFFILVHFFSRKI